MAMPRECFCFDFWFGTACGAIFCSGHWHNYFLQLGQAVRASVQSIFLRCLRQCQTQITTLDTNRIAQGPGIIQRYLRKADCSTHFSLWKIHLNRAKDLVPCKNQSRQARNRLGAWLPYQPACLPCWLACFVLWPLLALTFQSVYFYCGH